MWYCIKDFLEVTVYSINMVPLSKALVHLCKTFSNWKTVDLSGKKPNCLSDRVFVFLRYSGKISLINYSMISQIMLSRLNNGVVIFRIMFIFPKYNLYQYSSGDCATHWGKCQIFKHFLGWDLRVDFPPGRQRDLPGMMKIQRSEMANVLRWLKNIYT